MFGCLFLRLIMSAFCIAMLVAKRVPGQGLKLNDNARQQVISFVYAHNLIVINARVNGLGPFMFLLDTGVANSMITDVDFARSLNLHSSRVVNIIGFGVKDAARASIVSGVEVRIGRKMSGLLNFAVLDEDIFDLAAYTGLPVKGIIGSDFFVNHPVSINYINSKITIHRHLDPAVRKSESKLSMSIEHGKPYLWCAVADSSGHVDSLKLVIDTGAGHPLSLETLNGAAFPIPFPNINANLGVGLSGNISGYIARMPKLQVGSFQLQNVITAFPLYQQAAARRGIVDRNGNLGNGVLSRFYLTLDYAGNRLYLRKNPRYRQRFEHDMSGLSLAWAGPDYKYLVIARVEEHSAAALTGLKEGDRIIDINLKPIAAFTAHELYELLQSGNGNTLIVRVARQNFSQVVTVLLRLKRRI